MISEIRIITPSLNGRMDGFSFLEEEEEEGSFSPRHVDQTTPSRASGCASIRLTKGEEKRKREEKEERGGGRAKRGESFIYTRDILFILADAVSPVSNDTLGHVLRFVHVPSILRIVATRLRHLLMNSLSLDRGGLSISNLHFGRGDASISRNKWKLFEFIFHSTWNK